MTQVQQQAFDGCSNLKSVKIPSTLTTLPVFLFRNCKSLASLEVDPSNPDFQSISGIIYNKTGTAIVLVPEGLKGAFTIKNTVTTIGKMAFYGCKGISSITIPANVETIEMEAFSYCSGLTSLTIPSSVKNIGMMAFSDCTGLTSMTIPPNVTTIDIGLFSGCSGLTRMTIPSNIKTIKYCMFSFCSNLKEVTISSGVESIEDYAFEGCTSLQKITVQRNTPPVLESYAYVFADTENITSIVVPSASITTYKNAPYWSEFKSIITGY